MSAPWKCPECRAWVAPHVSEHRCDPPAAAVSVTSIEPPGSGGMFAVTSVPARTVITCNVTGALVSQQDLADRLQSMMLQRASQNWTLPGRAA